MHQQSIFLPYIVSSKNTQQLSLELVTYWMNVHDQQRVTMRIDDCLMRAALWKAEDIVTHSLHPGHRASNGEMPNDSLRRMGCRIPDWYTVGVPNDDNVGNNVESLGYNYSTLDKLFDAFWLSPHHQAHVYATDDFWKPHVLLGGCTYINPNPQQGQWLRVHVLVSTPESE